MKNVELLRIFYIPVQISWHWELIQKYYDLNFASSFL